MTDVEKKHLEAEIVKYTPKIVASLEKNRKNPPSLATLCQEVGCSAEAAKVVRARTNKIRSDKRTSGFDAYVTFQQSRNATFAADSKESLEFSRRLESSLPNLPNFSGGTKKGRQKSATTLQLESSAITDEFKSLMQTIGM